MINNKKNLSPKFIIKKKSCLEKKITSKQKKIKIKTKESKRKKNEKENKRISGRVVRSLPSHQKKK